MYSLDYLCFDRYNRISVIIKQKDGWHYIDYLKLHLVPIDSLQEFVPNHLRSMILDELKRRKLNQDQSVELLKKAITQLESPRKPDILDTRG